MAKPSYAWHMVRENNIRSILAAAHPKRNPTTPPQTTHRNYSVQTQTTPHQDTQRTHPQVQKAKQVPISTHHSIHTKHNQIRT
jgi:hypothetical protein